MPESILSSYLNVPASSLTKTAFVVELAKSLSDPTACSCSLDASEGEFVCRREFGYKRRRLRVEWSKVSLCCSAISFRGKAYQGNHSNTVRDNNSKVSLLELRNSHI